MRNRCRTPRTRNSAKSSTMPKRTSPFSSRLAGAIGIVGTAPSWGATALYTYATARCVHMVCFLVEFPKPLLPVQVLIRAMPYLAGVFSMFGLAGSQLM